MSEKRVHIDFDRILDTLRRGVRRADVFMGVGLNAADHEPPISHLLAPDDLHQIRLVKEQLSNDERRHVAEEFRKWVIGNGLRELLESFSIFMHKLYWAVFLIVVQQDKESILLRCPPKRFEQLGIGRQIQQLAVVIGVPERDVEIVHSLNQARNCYAHRRGLVGRPDVDPETGRFTLLWTTFRMELREPDGNIIPEPELFGKVLKNGGAVQLRIIWQERSFAMGEELVLGKREMKEICLCLLMIGQRLFKESVALAQKAGLLTEAVSDSLDEPKPV